MKIHLATLGRRILAFACDIVLVLMVALSLQTLAVMPIAMEITPYMESIAKYTEIKEDSHLFATVDDQYILIQKDYDENITLFYQDYIKDISIYETQKIDSTLFHRVDGVVVVKTETTATELLNFYQDALYKAEELLYSQDEVIAVTSVISSVSVFTISISVILSLSIFFLIIPLCLKNGTTIGKIFFGYGITNRQGYKVKKSQIIIRFLVFLFLEVILSVFLFGIPLFVSFTMAVFTKYGTSLHDYFAFTAVVETKNVTIYKDENEMKQDLERINSSPNFSLFKK